MDRVRVKYTGERAAPMTYTIRPGGNLYTPSGYIFGTSSSTAMLLPEEAAVLADLDADSGVVKIVGGKEVKLKNRDLVTVGANSPLPEGDKFDTGSAPKPKKAVTAATKKGDDQ